jgi:GNAT superfamily N-acetyltransferase
MFALLTDDALLRWQDGKVSGFPFETVLDAEIKLGDGPQAATPTGPFYRVGSPEHAVMALTKLLPGAELHGEVPVIPEFPDELDPEPLQEAAEFAERLHLRNRLGRFRDMPDLHLPHVGAPEHHALYNELGMGDEQLIDAVRKAVQERPERVTHGYTGHNSFFIVGDEVFSHNDWPNIPRDLRDQAVMVHSHSPDGLTGSLRRPDYFDQPHDKQPLNAEDMFIWIKGMRDRQMGPRLAMIYADGTMDVVGITHETDDKVLKWGQKRLHDSIGRAERDHMRAWLAERKFSYHEQLRWGTPDEARQIRALHPSESIRETGTAAGEKGGQEKLSTGKWVNKLPAEYLPRSDAARFWSFLPGVGGEKGDEPLSSLTTAENFAAVFDGFEHGGIVAHVEEHVQVNPPDAQLRVGGSLALAEVRGVFEDTTADGPRLGGQFDSYLARDEENKLRAFLSLLILKPEQQGRGFGTAFFQHMLEEYRRNGVHAVGLTAGDRVGGFHWAVQGFDFTTGLYSILASGEDLERRSHLYGDEKFARAYAVSRMWKERNLDHPHFFMERTYQELPPDHYEQFEAQMPTKEKLDAYAAGDLSALDGTFDSPQEIALFGKQTHTWVESHDPYSMGERMWLGKRFLLGAEWRGEMTL